MSNPIKPVKYFFFLNGQDKPLFTYFRYVFECYFSLGHRFWREKVSYYKTREGLLIVRLEEKRVWITFDEILGLKKFGAT